MGRDDGRTARITPSEMRIVWFVFAGSADDGSMTVTPTIAIASLLGVELTLAQALRIRRTAARIAGFTGFA
jgi:hypothetical protein